MATVLKGERPESSKLLVKIAFFIYFNNLIYLASLAQIKETKLVYLWFISSHLYLWLSSGFRETVVK